MAKSSGMTPNAERVQVSLDTGGSYVVMLTPDEQAQLRSRQCVNVVSVEPVTDIVVVVDDKPCHGCGTLIHSRHANGDPMPPVEDNGYGRPGMTCHTPGRCAAAQATPPLGNGQRWSGARRPGREPSTDPRVTMWTTPNSSSGQFMRSTTPGGSLRGTCPHGWFRRFFCRCPRRKSPFAGVVREN